MPLNSHSQNIEKLLRTLFDAFNLRITIERNRRTNRHNTNLLNKNQSTNAAITYGHLWLLLHFRGCEKIDAFGLHALRVLWMRTMAYAQQEYNRIMTVPYVCNEEYCRRLIHSTGRPISHRVDDEAWNEQKSSENVSISLIGLLGMCAYMRKKEEWVSSDERLRACAECCLAESVLAFVAIFDLFAVFVS